MFNKGVIASQDTDVFIDSLCKRKEILTEHPCKYSNTSTYLSNSFQE